MAYAFKQIEAHDPNNPGLVAPNASVTIFEPGDPTKTPLTLTTLAGDPLPNPVTVNGLGYGPAFMHATLPQVAWSGGGLTGTFESYEGMRDEAIAARTAAETAAATAGAEAAAVADAAIGDATAEAEAAAASAAAAEAAATSSATAAANSAALVGAPADTAIAAAINGTATATKTALNATYALKSELSDADAGSAIQLARRSDIQDHTLQGSGGWFLKRRNVDEYRFSRELGDGLYADHALVRTDRGLGGMSPQPLVLHDLAIGVPLIPEREATATYAGTGWAVVSTYSNSALPPVTYGIDAEQVTLSLTSGSGNYTVTSGNLSPNTRYIGRRISIPGAGAAGADLVTTVGNVFNSGATVSGSASSITATGVVATFLPGRRSSNVAGDTATYTTPADSTAVGIIHSATTGAGIATVSIDGSLTAANALPTAQELVDRGELLASQLTTGGGTIAPTTRVLDFYMNGEQFSIWRALATGLAPGAHTVVLTNVGKGTQSTGTRIYVQGWGYATAATSITTAGAYVFATIPITLHLPTIETAIDHKPTTAAAKAFVGGQGHGYETRSADPRVVVDGVVKTLTDGEIAPVAGTASFTRYSNLYHPENMATPSAELRCIYRLTRDGLTINQLVTWKVAGLVDSGYLAMMSVAPQLDRAQMDGSSTVYELDDLVTNPNNTYMGSGEHTSAAWWDENGTATTSVIVPASKQMTGGWINPAFKFTIRNFTKSSKLYINRNGPVAAGDKWGGEATYIIGNLPDGAGNYFPV